MAVDITHMQANTPTAPVGMFAGKGELNSAASQEQYSHSREQGHGKKHRASSLCIVRSDYNMQCVKQHVEKSTQTNHLQKLGCIFVGRFLQYRI